MPTVRVTTVWEDIEGARISVPLYFDTGDVSTVALAQTAFTTYEALMLAMSGSSIVSAEACFGLNVSGAQNPDNGYNNRSGAFLSFVNSDTIGDGLYIPAMLDDKLSGGIVDESDTQVAAFINEALNGTIPLSSRGSASLWLAYKIGKETIRKIKR